MTSWNPRAADLFGHTAEEALGQYLYVLIANHPDIHTEIETTWQSTPAQLHFIGQHTRKDGTLIDIELAGMLIMVNGERYEYILVYHDIGELVQTRREAEAASQARSEFVAHISHELRTPLNAIIGMTTLLLNMPVDALQRDYIETIRTSSDILLALINDVLDFARIEAQRIDLEYHAFNLHHCIEDSIDLLNMQARQKGLALSWKMKPDTPVVLVGDHGRVRQVLINLISNAIKFTEHGDIQVLVSAYPHSSTAPPTDNASDATSDPTYIIHIRVKDTGVGIAWHELEQIFEGFQQGEAARYAAQGGSGLGLTISRRLANMMGGTVWGESEPGAGSTFHFTFLARTARPEDIERENALDDLSWSSVSHLSTLRLLLVEDNHVNMKVMHRILELLGLWADSAANGIEALEALQRQPYDVILMDVQMLR
ncbi:MAG: response regulator [Chloroflexaceae bacterium]|nr:response regulator [Chloroflexaceae bacterium]